MKLNDKKILVANNSTRIIKLKLLSSGWKDNKYDVDVTNLPIGINTCADVILTEQATAQMLANDCAALYATNTVSDGIPSLTIHAIGNPLTADITIQLNCYDVVVYDNKV